MAENRYIAEIHWAFGTQESEVRILSPRPIFRKATHPSGFFVFRVSVALGSQLFFAGPGPRGRGGASAMLSL